MQGPGGGVSVGMRLGACRSLDMRNVEFEGLDDFKAFLEDEVSKAKIERLIETPGETIEDRAI